MQTVFIVGLGEIGSTIYVVLNQNKNFQPYGTDLDKPKCKNTMPRNHQTHNRKLKPPKFIEIIKTYIQKYQPKLTIINSTVSVGTTVELHKQTGGFITHSPCRGVHKNKDYMLKEFARWTKYVGGATPETDKATVEHFQSAGLRAKALVNCTDSEFANCLRLLIGLG